MKAKIIIVSVLAAFIMAMVPSIHAVEYDTAVEAKQKWVDENSKTLEELIDNNEAPDGLISFLFRILIKILLLPVKLAIKLAFMFANIAWSAIKLLIIFPIKLLLWLLPPY